MNMTDPIADMLTRIRNGVQARHETVDIPASKTKVEIAKILKSEGYIINYSLSGEKAADKKITVTLKYGPNDEKVITGIKRISKPGLRVYAKYDDLPRVLNGLGIAIISTSSGMMTDKEARAKHAGGEIVAYVW
ncbi:MAG: 30S ribosomal protein S8 [Erysipelotrichaceae bacterium]|nr:30S ribosomal protein S8 [Erysipelotrichaceae bacterium]